MNKQAKLDLDFVSDLGCEIKKPLLLHGDCLDLMTDISDKSIDMICCDLPYGITQNKWDSVIPFDKLWEQYSRIIKDGCAIVLFASQPFTSAIIMSNVKLFCYHWIWNKSQSTGFLNAYKMPLKKHEEILIFSSNGRLPKYFPIITDKEPKNIRKKDSVRSKYSENYGKVKIGVQTRIIPANKAMPDTILSFKVVQKTVHPTQKPVELLQYLMKTYSKPGDTVLDNCMGSGSCGVAAKTLNRNFIGIEKEEKYFQIAKQRIEDA